MIVSSQIRAARAALGWTAAKLAEQSGIGLRTIMRIEADEGIPKTTTGTLTKVQSALESVGIEFIGTPDNGPGIRFRPR